MSEKDLILAIHHTTAFSFSWVEPIEGLGRLHQKKGNRGFFGHFCIAATVQREIIGILGLAPWVRSVAELTTARAAMLAVAALGGHLKHNGLPGWQVLARGYEKH